MKTITIDEDLFSEIDKHATGPFTHSDVIRKWCQHFRSVSKGDPAKTKSDAAVATSGLVSFVQSPAYKALHKGVDKYLSILGWIYKNRMDEFSRIENFQRGNRAYFAKSQKSVEEGGQGNIHAKRISDSPYWALVTLDNRTKREILMTILRLFAFSAGEIQLVVATIPDSDRSRNLEHLLNQYV